ncbi:MAG TPA: type II secretion system F family protein [Bryobacteraceae bacterium]|nr:type II secretion system F family protein [Bryobacteraceae bacterium]
MLVAILILFFAITCLVAWALLVAGSALLERRLGQAPGGTFAGPSPADETPLLLRRQLLSSISVWHELLARFDFIEILKMRIAEAGLKWSVGRTTLVMLLLGSVGAAILLAMDWAPIISVPLAAAAGIFVPFFYILHKRTARFRKIEEQFPDALDSLSRAMRAGHPFVAGMELLAAESPEPLAQEMRKTYDEWKLGLAWNEALENLTRRVPLVEIRLFAAAVALQNRFGGRLNEILEELAKSTRDSISLRGDVRASSAQGRMSGTVLTILPIIITLIMFVTSPEYIEVLFKHPDGKYLIAAALCCLVLGHFAIRRIVNIKA